MTSADKFASHQIRQTVEADDFASWLLMRPREDGGWDSAFWVRITAADGLLRVSGDFNPIVFAHGPRDPRACVGWMGSHPFADSYVLEKARIGMGGDDAVYRWDSDDARRDAHELIGHEVDYRDEDDEPTDLERALRAALESSDEYSGKWGCFLFQREAYNALLKHNPDDNLDIASIGRRTSHALELAHAAVRRLHALLLEDSP